MIDPSTGNRVQMLVPCAASIPEQKTKIVRQSRGHGKAGQEVKALVSNITTPEFVHNSGQSNSQALSLSVQLSSLPISEDKQVKMPSNVYIIC